MKRLIKIINFYDSPESILTTKVFSSAKPQNTNYSTTPDKIQK
jgi:hypothetical protein